jgi:hypothetical protein
MLHLLVVAAGNDLSHALHVATFGLVKAANVALCAARHAACCGAEQSGERGKMGIQPLANRADQRSNAISTLRPSYSGQTSKCSSKTTDCIIRTIAYKRFLRI